MTTELNPAIEAFIKTQTIDSFFCDKPTDLNEPAAFELIRHGKDSEIDVLFSTMSVNNGFECTDNDSLAELIMDEYWRLKHIAIEVLKLSSPDSASSIKKA